MKTTMLQYFQWYSPNDGKTWTRLKQEAKRLQKLGYSAVWLPPAYKCMNGINDVGYGVYDLYDLGEFDQKGAVRTKYGTKQEYLEAMDKLHEHQIMALADIVLNHRMGADGTQKMKAVQVNPQNRDQPISDLHEIEAWTDYRFDGRNKQYSDFEWNWTDFKGTDYDALHQQNGIFLFEGKQWDNNVSKEEGNFDYIMGADVDFNSDRVRGELYNWGKWYQQTTGIDGFRLDAVKSIDSDFYKDWLNMMFDTSNSAIPLSVGEWWSGDVELLLDYIEKSGRCMRLFDVPLHFNLFNASKANGNYDIRKIFDNTLTQREPNFSVAFVDNHDTQPSQALESWVEDWFKTSAYALLLLHEVQVACVFEGDRAGIAETGNPPVAYLEEMVWLRNHLLGQEILDFNDDDPQKMCWVVTGLHPIGVLITIGNEKSREVQVQDMAGKTMVNMMNPEEKQVVDENGNWTMQVKPGGCSVYLSQEDYDKLQEEMKKINRLKDPEIQAEQQENGEDNKQ